MAQRRNFPEAPLHHAKEYASVSRLDFSLRNGHLGLRASLARDLQGHDALTESFYFITFRLSLLGAREKGMKAFLAIWDDTNDFFMIYRSCSLWVRKYTKPVRG